MANALEGRKTKGTGTIEAVGVILTRDDGVLNYGRSSGNRSGWIIRKVELPGLGD